jgi:proteasome lid subunit RPN8/RPN11
MDPALTFNFSSILTIHDQVKLFPTLETGGLLAGHGDLVLYALAAGNAAEDQGSEYTVAPDLFARHLTSMEEEGLELIGTYHSHPNGNAQMSAADAAMAKQTGKLLIIGPGQCWDWRLWDPVAGAEADFVIASPCTVQR